MVEKVTYSLGWLLGYRGIPQMSRPTFRYEFIGQLFANLAGAMLLPPTIQLVAVYLFSGDKDATAKLVALSMFGLAAGGFIAKFLATRKRIPYIVGARAGIGAVLLATAFLPASHDSLIYYAILIAPAAIFSSVIINIQSGIWQSNYPPSCRGRIISRILVFKLLCLALGTQTASFAIKTWDIAFPIVYIVAAAFCILSAWSYSRIRIRREKAIIRTNAGEKFSLAGGLHILWEDHDFARYMGLQMLSGICVLSLQALWIPQMKARLDIDIFTAAAFTVLIPSAVNVIFSPIAGHIFDHMGTMRYRMFNTAAWASTQLLLFLGIFIYSFPLIIVGYFMMGVSKASGGVVWNIGHTRFAPPGKGQLYMGVHMTLTGLRGVTMPLVGAWLFDIIGFGVMVAAVVLQFLVSIAFFFCPEPKAANHQSKLQP